jgi:hypothetical protein
MVYHLSTMHSGWRTREWIEDLHKEFFKFDTIILESCPSDAPEETKELEGVFNQIAAGNPTAFESYESRMLDKIRFFRNNPGFDFLLANSTDPASFEFQLAVGQAVYDSGCKISLEANIYDEKTSEEIRAVRSELRDAFSKDKYPITVDIDNTRKWQTYKNNLWDGIHAYRDQKLSEFEDSTAVVLGSGHCITTPAKTVQLDGECPEYLKIGSKVEQVDAFLLWNMCNLPFYKKRDPFMPRNISSPYMHALLANADLPQLLEENRMENPGSYEPNTYHGDKGIVEYYVGKFCIEPLANKRRTILAAAPDLSWEYEESAKPFLSGAAFGE